MSEPDPESNREAPLSLDKPNDPFLPLGVIPLRRMLGVLLIAVLLGSGCSGEQDIYEVSPADEQLAAGGPSEDLVELPEPAAAVPVFAIKKNKPITRTETKALTKMKGAAAIAQLSIRTVRVKGPKRTARLKVAALDPIGFRSVAPPSTRTADFVWLSLLGGDAVLTHEAAKKIGLKDPTELRFGNAGKIRVGALADNGTPNHADVMISEVGVKDWKGSTTIVVGAKTGASLSRLKDSIRKSVRGGRLIRLIPGSATTVPEASSPGSVQAPLPTLSGMHPVMADAVHKLISASNGRVWLVSGFRDAQRQYQLWVGALEKYGDPDIADNWVARPGHSMHEAGLAADLGGDLDLAVRLISELKLPLWRPMTWEPWHFELVGSR